MLNNFNNAGDGIGVGTKIDAWGRETLLLLCYSQNADIRMQIFSASKTFINILSQGQLNKSMKTFLYSELNIPAPPDWLIEQAYEKINACLLNPVQPNGVELINKDGTHQISSGDNSLYFTKDSAADIWARTNIEPKLNDIRAFVAINKSGQAKWSQGPHTDTTRTHTLIYLLDAGGDNIKTVFYKEQGIDNIDRGFKVRPTDYAKLDPIESIELKINTWTLLNATVIHSVENLSRARKTIQVALNFLPTQFDFTNATYY